MLEWLSVIIDLTKYPVQLIVEFQPAHCLWENADEELPLGNHNLHILLTSPTTRYG